MRRTAEDAAKTRIALLKAALLSFEEKGWREATLKHIAERAGVTRGGLQHHFHDKQTLLDAALQWGWSDYGRRLFEDLDADPDGNASNHPREAIEELLSRFVRLVTGEIRCSGRWPRRQCKLRHRRSSTPKETAFSMTGTDASRKSL